MFTAVFWQAFWRTIRGSCGIFFLSFLSASFLTNCHRAIAVPEVVTLAAPPLCSYIRGTYSYLGLFAWLVQPDLSSFCMQNMQKTLAIASDALFVICRCSWEWCFFHLLHFDTVFTLYWDVNLVLFIFTWLLRGKEEAAEVRQEHNVLCLIRAAGNTTSIITFWTIAARVAHLNF